MNERVAISVSSSPVSQVGVGVGGEYVVSGRDRPRISLLPAPGSVAPPSSSPTAPDYHAAAARNPRAMMTMQPQEYRSAGPQDMAGLQESPAFKKIRLGQPNQAQTQPHSQCPTMSNIDVCNKQKHAQQLQQPLRIDTRVGSFSSFSLNGLRVRTSGTA